MAEDFLTVEARLNTECYKIKYGLHRNQNFYLHSRWCEFTDEGRSRVEDVLPGATGYKRIQRHSGSRFSSR